MINKTKQPVRTMPEGFRLIMTTREARAVATVLKEYRGYKCREAVCQDVARLIELQIAAGAGERMAEG